MINKTSSKMNANALWNGDFVYDSAESISISKRDN